MSNPTKDVEALLTRFRAAMQEKSPKLAECKKLLSQLKVLIHTKFNLLPPFTGDLNVVKKQLLLARETLELATIMSVLDKDVASFERHVAQVKPYYSDTASLIPESERRLPILGLQLMFLLAHNRIAEFHTELELIATSDQSNTHISYPVELEQHLMEGSYNKLLTARKGAPKYCEYFIDLLVDTVRDKIADCCEKAYDSFPLNEAPQLLMLPTQKEVIAYLSNRKWEVKGDTIYFNKDKGDNLDIPSHDLIRESLIYATDLERIV